MIGIDISSIYKQAFNIELFDNVSFPNVQSSRQANPEILFPNVTGEAQKDKYFSYLKLPVQMPVIFKGGNYKKLNKGKIETLKVADLRLADTTLVDFSRAKNLITTPINGGNGTVTEFYSFDDWQIKIYGLIFPTDTDTDTQLKSLLDFEGLADAISVENEIFSLLDIHQIEIISIDLPQLKAQFDVRPFTLTCKSTEALELIL
jgi:hypothetical protein